MLRVHTIFTNSMANFYFFRKKNDSAGKILNRVARFNKVELPMMQVNDELETKKDDSKQSSEISSIFLQPKLRYSIDIDEQ